MAPGMLVFIENKDEKSFFENLFKIDDFPVYETHLALEAMQILQDKDIGLIIAGSVMEGIEGQRFKLIAEKMRPGVKTVLIGPLSREKDGFLINTDEFKDLIRTSVKTEHVLRRELGDSKQLIFALADRLLQIFGVNDRYFFNNDHLVAELSAKLAVKMGLEEDLVESIRMSALLRDLGKVGIQLQILEGTVRLNQTELTPIKEHPIHTVQLLRQIQFPWDLDLIISQHHEHYDGSGYPHGAKGRQISVGARILSVADAYYAMTTDRPYRKALSHDKALEEIRRNAGSQFDPEVVEVFLSIIKEEPTIKTSEKNILIFEREDHIAALIKLSTNADEMQVYHTSSSIDAIVYIRHKKPALVITDIEALQPEETTRVSHIVLQMAIAQERKVLVITPDKNYPKIIGGDVEYIAKPLDIGKLTQKIHEIISKNPPPVPREPKEGLTGKIEEFSLPDIIQILSLGMKTAKVEIEGDRGSGKLYILNGKIVHASVGNLRGANAFLEIVNWESGQFCIKHGQVTDDINVTASTNSLLLEVNKNTDRELTA
jgi:HD-GYP domain-containing protein (c-di-GMP phosphodiesterase class II)/DNA-binding NarL/FixJ family response regulator